jgi:hypothetical protein
MGSVTLQFPPAQDQRIIDALCLDGGWTPEMGVTKAAFAKEQIAAMVRQKVVEVETAAARRAVTPPVPPDVT